MKPLRLSIQLERLTRAIDWICYVWALLCGGYGTVSLASVVEAAADYSWMLAACLLRPFSRSPGPYERRCFARALRSDQPQYDVQVQHIDTNRVNNGKDMLRGTLWLPKGRGPFPAVLVRSPYCLHTNVEWGHIAIAERGYAVLLQDTRGRLGSEGQFVPVEHERVDGPESVAWVRQQPWCDGRVAVYGPSYLGLTSWACVGGCRGGELQAAMPVIAQSRLRPALFQGGPTDRGGAQAGAEGVEGAGNEGGGDGGRDTAGEGEGGGGEGGGFSLELCVLWLYLVFTLLSPAVMRSPLALARTLYRDVWRRRLLHKACMHAPLHELDQLLMGDRHAFVQEVLETPQPSAPFWHTHSSTLCDLPPPLQQPRTPLEPPYPVSAGSAPPVASPPHLAPKAAADATSLSPLPPVHIYTCWYDVFLVQAVNDFAAIAPRTPGCRLVVGAHDHWSVTRLSHLQIMLRGVIECLDTHMPSHAKGDGTPDAADAANAPSRAEAPAAAPAAAAAAAAATGAPAAPPAVPGPGSSGPAPWRRIRLLPPLRHFDANRPAAECALPVQLCFVGSQRWVGYASWPPPASPTPFYLHPSRLLSREPPPQPPQPQPRPRPSRTTTPSRTTAPTQPTQPTTPTTPARKLSFQVLSYVYSPSAPTPSAGGPSFNPLNSGAHSQRRIERRSDVLVFTTPPLRANTTRIAGHVTLTLRVATSTRTADILGRLCLVTPLLGSVNLCEGLVSLVAAPGEEDADGIGGEHGRLIRLELGPIAAEAARGSRLRLHVASAAHPRWARNLCADPETPWAARRAGASTCRVHVWADGSSQLVLPLEQC